MDEWSTGARAGSDDSSLPGEEHRFYVEWTNGAPFFEDTLVGQELRVGEEVVIKVVKRDVRCKIVGIDPNDAIAQPDILAAVVHNHQGCAGVYASVVREGTVKEGDAIT